MKAVRRILAGLLLFVLALPLAFRLGGYIWLWLHPERAVHGEISPYSLHGGYEERRRDGQTVEILTFYLCEKDTERQFSLYPYYHYNGDWTLPLTPGEPFSYALKKVRYRFQVEEALRIAAVEFYARDHWRSLLLEEGKLYERRIDSGWPFNGRHVVCELPEGTGFYDPIAISGLDGCGILLLYGEDPGRKGDISVYVRKAFGWEQAPFQLPDGTLLEQVQGYAHRQVDPTAQYSVNSAVGKLELCLEGPGGCWELYQVTYSDGVLLLTLREDIALTGEDLLNWVY